MQQGTILTPLPQIDCVCAFDVNVVDNGEMVEAGMFGEFCCFFDPQFHLSMVVHWTLVVQVSLFDRNCKLQAASDEGLPFILLCKNEVNE